MNMYKIIRDNCLMTLLLSVSTGPDGDLDDLLAESKDVTKTRKSITSRALQGGVTIQEDQKPAIERNDAIDLNYSLVGSAYLIFRTRDGMHREPIKLRLTAPASPSDMARFEAAPIWRPPSDAPGAPTSVPTIGPVDSPERRARHQRLRSLIDEILAAETWKVREE